uniref:Uncharacterized protein n=1 Tax=Haemonchus contortus TaxID=6289 RepID=A0A7I4Y6K1_HAECO
MCVHKKKGKGAAGKSKRAGTGKSKDKTKKAGSAGSTLKDSKSDQQPVGAAGAAPEKDDDQNMMAKPCSDDVLKKEKKKEPLHIKVPPPRVLKAKRSMNEVKEAKDPEYKTLELDSSEWESAKIMKRSDLKTEDIEKKEFVEPAGQEKQEKEVVEAAA